jgi:predicted secreted protein
LTGGISHSIIGNIMIYYILGWVALLAYLPLYLWRHLVEDPKHAKKQAGGEKPGTRTPGTKA